MTDSTATVLELLEKRIESLEQMEILLLLHHKRDQAWTAHDIGAQLPQSGQVDEALGLLRAAGLVQAVTTAGRVHYAYRPISPQLDHAVTELARQYREQPIPIMKILSAKSIRRLRMGAARAFADAFVLRKRKDDEHG